MPGKNRKIEVSEAPGLYGTLKIEEKLIQKIWHDQEFIKENLQTTEGKGFEILNFGNWNLAEEGPDFKDAELSFDGNIISGDIEIHFDEKDWQKHGHHQDPAYAKVILHVVLYPPQNSKQTLAANSMGKIPTLVLLPYLLKSIEEYAEDLAVEKLAGMTSTSSIPENFPEDWNEAREMARERWRQKCLYAQKRLHSTRWEVACHQWFLEVLGYRRNRAPMAKIALRFPLKVWMEGLNPEDVYSSETNWKLRGSRPANHPRKRLEQYAQIMKSRPNWMEKLKSMNFSNDLPEKSENLANNRKILGIKIHEKEFADEVLGGSIGGTRLHTLMVDACLPLWSVQNQKDIFETWFHWSAGDVPAKFRSWSRGKGLTNRAHPFCNGLAQAIIQGSL